MTVRLLIAGSRSWSPTLREISAAVGATLRPLEIDPLGVGSVVCGMARGADLAGKAWAERWGYPVEQYPADWDGRGNRAGPERNERMASIATHAVLFRDVGESRGTDDMARRLKARGTPHRVWSRTEIASVAP